MKATVATARRFISFKCYIYQTAASRFPRLWVRSCARLFKIAHRHFSVIQRGTFGKLQPRIPLKVLRRKLFYRVRESGKRLRLSCAYYYDVSKLVRWKKSR